MPLWVRVSFLPGMIARNDMYGVRLYCFYWIKSMKPIFLPMTLHICSVFADESRLINAKSQGKAIKQMGVIVCLQQKNCVTNCNILRISVVLLLYLNICSFTKLVQRNDMKWYECKADRWDKYQEPGKLGRNWYQCGFFN